MVVGEWDDESDDLGLSEQTTDAERNFDEEDLLAALLKDSKVSSSDHALT